MTIAVITRELIVTDSRLSFGDVHAPLRVGKIFKRKGGGIFTTAGDTRRTYHFEKHMVKGKEPPPLDTLEDEDFDGAILLPDKRILYYDCDYAGVEIMEEFVIIGSSTNVARSWLLHGGDPVLAVRRTIEVDTSCGGPIVLMRPNGKIQIIEA